MCIRDRRNAGRSSRTGRGCCGPLVSSLVSVGLSRRAAPSCAGLSGAIFLVGEGLSGLTFLILITRFPAQREPMAGVYTKKNFHDYGKLARAGRKVGHLTVCADSPADLEAKIAAVRALLEA